MRRRVPSRRDLIPVHRSQCCTTTPPSSRLFACQVKRVKPVRYSLTLCTSLLGSSGDGKDVDAGPAATHVGETPRPIRSVISKRLVRVHASSLVVSGVRILIQLLWCRSSRCGETRAANHRNSARVTRAGRSSGRKMDSKTGAHRRRRDLSHVTVHRFNLEFVSGGVGESVFLPRTAYSTQWDP